MNGVRSLRPGGVLYIDHERSPGSWEPNAALRRLRREVSGLRGVIRTRGWYRLRHVTAYAVIVRRLLQTRYEPEADIHVWSDDRVDWPAIERLLELRGCTVLLREDHLLYQRKYPPDLYAYYESLCSDTRLLIARKAHDADQPRTSSTGPGGQAALHHP